ncbi:hypothetical protein ACKC9G_18450 [Pokkaliibacter sp. CJK22405]|uniref:hypothetical protein n=1 Tax=Pokkaliibacter sp. CJK22405 TaxID=3384615 RepID=UPI003984D2E4
MKFKLTKDRQFVRTVTVLVPNESGGHDEQTLTARFKIADVETVMSSAQPLLDLVLVGLQDCEDSDMSEAEMLEAVKKDVCAAPALVREYNDAVAKKNYG